MSDDNDVAVFDIGGTCFRSALWHNGAGLRCIKRCPAINYLNTAHDDPLELQLGLVEHVITEFDRLACQSSALVSVASLSLGAPVDVRSGLVLKSGPLWGPASKPFDLFAALRQRRPEISWIIANDITAALFRYVNEIQGQPCARLLLVTVSTGIGARLYDYHRQAIPVDAVNGIQGEIGHIPVEAVFRGRRISYRCDCGGESHLNACSSGRAIGSLLRELPHLAFETLNGSALGSAYCSGDETDESRHTTFRSAVAAGDALALEVLDFLTRPLARMFATILTHDPLVDAIVLTGGVVDALGSRYVESLNQQFIEYDMFQVTKADPNYLRRRLRVAPPDDQGGLIGAGYIALAAASGRKIYAFV